jgi:uncharacterized membrane protein YhiD involved in acid resistance
MNPIGLSGLTTAGGLWLTTATGIAVGVGRVGLAALAVALTWVTFCRRLVSRIERAMASPTTKPDDGGCRPSGEASQSD